MRVLVMYDYPPSPNGLSTQADLLYRGLFELGIDVQAVHLQSSLEKEWYYRWFKPDVVVGVGYLGHLPDLVFHPQKHGIAAVPWLVADGFIANYHDLLNKLPLILVTSNWVKEMYVSDGINASSIEVLPVGCDVGSFIPLSQRNPKIRAIRESLDVLPEQLMILTVGDDAASKGAQEVMHALVAITQEVPDWKYICKVRPQPETEIRNQIDLELAAQLNIEKRISFVTGIASRNFMPHLMAACDIYAAPSRFEGFGMAQIEAGACEKPVIGLKAMGMLDTMIHDKTALLAEVAAQNVVNEVSIPHPSDPKKDRKVGFDIPRTVDYRANTLDIAAHLKNLMTNADLRRRLGKAARRHVSEHFDYKLVAKRFVEIIKEKLEII